MEYRVDELAARAGVSVDTLRFYKSKGLMGQARRVGRIALYDDRDLERLRHIRALQAKGFTLVVIGRILTGEMDAVDEALVEAVMGDPDFQGGSGLEEFLTLAELAQRAGVPVALLQALEAESVLIPRRHEGEARYTDADLTALRAGLHMLEHGLPLSEVLELARQYHDATKAVATRAVTLFDEHVRQSLRRGLKTPGSGMQEAEAARRVVEAFRQLLPATVTLVAHQFRRTLLAAAQEHIEAVGDKAELAAVRAEALNRLESAVAVDG